MRWATVIANSREPCKLAFHDQVIFSNNNCGCARRAGEVLTILAMAVKN
jgi:hypothetical protein